MVVLSVPSVTVTSPMEAGALVYRGLVALRGFFRLRSGRFAFGVRYGGHQQKHREERDKAHRQ